ncbi:MAG: methyltransferase [Terrimesophilobacter sp.]
MMSTPQDAVAEKTWVAFGPAGALGTVHKIADGYTFKLLSDENYRANYPSLDVAKNALYAALDPGTDWPEFREH